MVMLPGQHDATAGEQYGRGFEKPLAATVADASTYNQPPNAAFGFDPASPRTGDPVTFDGSASSDPDGSIAKYEWDLDGNGSFETDSGTSPQVTHVYAKSGTYPVSLRVTDDDGGTDVVEHDITVTNRPPQAAFTFSPASPRKKDPVTFDAAASKDPDGSISRYEWDLDGNGTFEADTGGSATVTHSYAKVGTYTVSLRVTDDEGATDRVSHDVTVTSRKASVGKFRRHGGRHAHAL
jgi:YD repeat-containing protein